ncbi:MAG: hypothetical protein KDD40_11340, partial [Bdellovibrionales bacterium]|nr:hypothetical protein [Bdellovibrionales bacterium]
VKTTTDKGHFIYLLEDVITESMISAQSEFLIHRLRTIKEIFNNIGLHKFSILKSYQKIINMEIERNHTLQSGQFYKGTQLQNFINFFHANSSDIQRILTQKKQYLSQFYEKKLSLLEHDKVFRNRALIDVDPSFKNLRLKYFKKYRYELYDAPLSHLRSILKNGLSRRKFRKIRYYKNEHCLATKTLSDLLTLRFLLNACGGRCTVESLKEAQRIDKGNWVDILIASGASYSDVFISEDKRLRLICNYLKEKGLLFFSTLDLISYINDN